jgi:hypothetical protein
MCKDDLHFDYLGFITFNPTCRLIEFNPKLRYDEISFVGVGRQFSLQNFCGLFPSSGILLLLFLKAPVRDVVLHRIRSFPDLGKGLRNRGGLFHRFHRQHPEGFSRTSG